MLNQLHRIRLQTGFSKSHKFEKPKTDIVELYVQLVNGKVKMTGKVAMVKCCFHEDGTPSLALYPATSSYYCFGCSKHGDSINFVMEVEHCSFKEALEIIKKYEH